jgi:guanylate kinase
MLAAGRWVLLEIDVQGHRQIKAARPDAVSFFIRAPSTEGYRDRLRRRGTESEEVIARRSADAALELQASPEYDFQIVNETVPQAVRTLRTLLWGLTLLRGKRDAG